MFFAFFDLHKKLLCAYTKILKIISELVEQFSGFALINTFGD